MAPHLLLRRFVGTNTGPFTHVKLVVLSNQCTGQNAFQGEQDQDPANVTDCRSTVIANQVRVAELQVFGEEPQVLGATRVE